MVVFVLFLKIYSTRMDLCKTGLIQRKKKRCTFLIIAKCRIYTSILPSPDGSFTQKNQDAPLQKNDSVPMPSDFLCCL